MIRFGFTNNKSEQGSIIILALILLILVTLMGVSITQTTSIEMRIAGNERDFKNVFYLAEAAAMEALQRLENASADDLKLPSSLAWLYDTSTDLEDKPTMSASGTVSVIDPDTRFAATARGITGGTSLSMTTSSQLYTFDAYGYSAGRGLSHIVAGYKRRF